MEEIKDLIFENNKGNLLIGGDFNARIGDEGTIIQRDARDEIGRRSKDRVINIESNKFLEEIEFRNKFQHEQEKNMQDISE